MRRHVVLIVCLLAFALASTADACTSLCMVTESGPVYGANMDFPWGDGHLFVNKRGVAKEGWHAGTTGVNVKWTSRYGSVTFNLLGREFAWGGLNEAGLAISTMELLASEYEPRDETPGVNAPIWVQHMLDTCGTVEEVLAADARVRVEDVTPCHFMLADAAGGCAVIEFTADGPVHHHGESLPFRTLANALYVDGVRHIESGYAPAFNPGRSVERMATAERRMRRWLDRPEGPAVDWVFGILTEDVCAPKKWWTNLFRDSCTRWSMVFEIAERRIHFRTVDREQVRWIDLDDLDFSCDTPLSMLDVNAELEGNITGAFEPYDHDLNVDLMTEFFRKFKSDVTQEGAEALVDHFDGFGCLK